MPRIAFFDLDRTLISVNSAGGWMKRELRLGYLKRRQAAQAAGWLGLYHLGFARIEQAIEDAVATLQGSEEEELRQRTLAFWDEEIAATVRPGAREAIARHRAAGDVLATLTSSSIYMCEAVERDLGIDQHGCNRFEVVDGLFTGQAHKPLCYGPGKVDHARRIAGAHGLTLADAVFYTDSFSDLPPLEAVGEPVVINPDPRLRREAKRRGWPVHDWGGSA